MSALLVITAIVGLPVLLIAVNAFVTAPKGYQDDKGFHYDN